jgi:4-amino-4-deoxy-L-arabinose transferase-like glycosyltransferase
MLRSLAAVAVAIALVALVRAADKLTPRTALWSTLIVAAVLRVAWAIATPGIAVSDPVIYINAATTLAAGEGYVLPDGSPSAYMPIGYPFVLSLAFRVFGPSLATARGLQVLLSIVVVALTWYAARELAGERVARAAAAILAVWPSQIWAVGVAYSDILAQVALLAAFAVGFRERRELALIAGLFIGLGVHVRPAVSIAVPVLLAVWLLRHKGWAWRAAALALGIALGAGPWVARNYFTLGHAVTSTNGGLSLWVGAHEGATGGYMEPDWETLPADEVERDREAARRGTAWIREHPVAWLRLIPAKMWNTFSSDVWALYASFRGVALLPRWFSWFAQLTAATYLAMLALAAIGFVVASRRRAWGLAAVAALPLLGIAVVQVFAFGDSRYNFLGAPCLAISAAYGCQNIGNRFGDWWRRKRSAPGSENDGA